MTKLFRTAKDRIQTAIEARYTGYEVEKLYSDYVMFRYFGQWLWIIEDLGRIEVDGEEVPAIRITHCNASFPARSAWTATFTEVHQISDMMVNEFKPIGPEPMRRRIDGNEKRRDNREALALARQK